MHGSSQIIQHNKRHGPGRILIQKATRGRAQIIPDYIPELVSWLWMIGKRYERTLMAVDSSNKKFHDRYLKGVSEHCESTIEIIQRLIDVLPNRFPSHEWWKAWEAVCTEFNITEKVMENGKFVLDETYTDGEGI